MVDEPQNSPPPESAQEQEENRQFSFEQLAEGAQEVVITHDGQEYRLRITRNGKLILNK